MYGSEADPAAAVPAEIAASRSTRTRTAAWQTTLERLAYENSGIAVAAKRPAHGYEVVISVDEDQPHLVLREAQQAAAPFRLTVSSDHALASSSWGQPARRHAEGPAQRMHKRPTGPGMGAGGGGVPPPPPGAPSPKVPLRALGAQ
jgi:hypothetical protein